MAKDDLIELQGVVTDVYAGGNYKIRISENHEVLGRLNGKIHLIIGNNDSAAIVSRAEFQSAQHYPG